MECRGTFESSLCHLDEVSLLAQDESLVVRHGEIFLRFGIRLQQRFVGLISCQTIERNQTPRHIIPAFIRQKIAYDVSAASGNDAAPIRRVLLESVPLERIDLVTEDSRYCHRREYAAC